MTRETYSRKNIINALENRGFHRVDRAGNHVKLKYITPDTGDTQYVTVPLHDELAPGTLRSIAEQAGATDLQAFLNEIDQKE